MTAKDAWVEHYYDTVVEYRSEIEEDVILQKQGTQKYTGITL